MWSMMAALQSTALTFDGDGLLKSTQTKLYGAQLEYTRHHLLLSLAFISKTFVNISAKCVRDEPSGRETGDRKGNWLAASELSE